MRVGREGFVIGYDTISDGEPFGALRLLVMTVTSSNHQRSRWLP